ncbi:hypothetical protein IQ259_10295 [Fortiea sp. LEGE XX443]|uniref:hypothetical protein n=1 Tax=Fortiea sp. LEGE XX443 TaxID=1828611 RepID=UPI00187E7AE7|nr:hypothetical protein [Fortiea sp. LEGE XX443]MBE9005423.1 hypothetical protein [Fortiea sp. LEGE XX443]
MTYGTQLIWRDINLGDKQGAIANYNQAVQLYLQQNKISNLGLTQELSETFLTLCPTLRVRS